MYIGEMIVKNWKPLVRIVNVEDPVTPSGTLSSKALTFMGAGIHAMSSAAQDMAASLEACGASASELASAMATMKAAGLLPDETKGMEIMAKKPLEEEHYPILLEVGQMIVDKCKALDAVFEVEGSPMATIKRESGEYRKLALFGGWQFFLKSVYLGTRNSLIFVADPIENHETFALAEFDAKDIDTAFPLMGGVVGEAFGINSENLPEIIQQLTTAAIAKAKIDAVEALGVAESHPNWGRF